MSSDIAETFEDSQARPTGIRYLVVGIAVLMAVLLYLDRFCVSFAERYIKEDLRLSDTQMAWFISVFFWSYALAQVPSGWLGDRFGVRGVLTAYILMWSLFTALIGLAWGFAILLIMRLGCGLAQAGAYPSSAGLLKKWVPLSNRAFASALVGLGGRLGGAVAPILTASLMVMFVPLSTPALLDDTQILDAQKLYDKLSVCGQFPAGTSTLARAEPSAGAVVAAPSPNPAAVRICELLPADTRPRIAERDSEPDGLVVALNRVLERRDLYSDEAFGSLNLSREALGFIKRQRSGESLTGAETVRLNRLLLEAAFPEEIRKLYGSGWRPVLVIYGLAGLIVAVGFWIIVRNTPAQHPWCNGAERSLVFSGSPAPATPPAIEKNGAPPMRAILRSRSQWLSSIAQFGTNVAWLFFVTWLPRYLMEIYDVPILERSVMTSIPALAGIAGMFLGGKLTDWLTRKVGVRWGRALPMGLTRFGAAAAYLSCLWIDSPWMATVAFSVGFFCTDLGVSAVWAFAQDVGGRHVGAVLGWGNMWGNLGAAVAPPLYDLVLGASPQIADWNRMFMLCAAMFAVAGIAALGIDSTVPVVAEDE